MRAAKNLNLKFKNELSIRAMNPRQSQFFYFKVSDLTTVLDDILFH